MADEPQTITPTPTSSLPADTPAPTLPDPQKLVDEALTTPAKPLVDSQISQTMTDTSFTPTDTAPSVPTPAPAAESAVSSPAAASSEEMPLAFAATMPSTPTAEPVPTPSPVPSTPAETPVPPMGNLPPITPAPIQPAGPAPKKKGGKLVAALLGFFLLVAGLGGGYYYYTNYVVQKVQVAAISQAQCHGCRNGGWAVWRNGSCHITGICDSGVPGKDTSNPDADIGNSSDCTAAGYSWCEATDATGRHYAFCNTTSGSTIKSCNNLATEKGYSVQYGANPSRGACSAAQKAAGWTECPAGTCGGGSGAYCFDRHGSCNSTIIQRSDGTYVDTGLCGIVGSLAGNDKNSGFTEKSSLFCTQADVTNNVGQCATVGVGGLKYKFVCDANGCSTTDAACVIMHYTCQGSTTGNNSCLQNGQQSTGSNFTGKCGTVEQIDVACGSYVESRTRINGKCAEASSSTTNPTFKCDSIAKDKATPKIGDSLTFTCAGSSTPANSVALTYQFRISKDGGAWSALTATANKATYKVTEKGSYDVQCKACGKVTATAASTCDPNWSTAQ